MKLRMLLLRRINLSEARSVSRGVLMKRSLSEIDVLTFGEVNQLKKEQDKGTKSGRYFLLECKISFFWSVFEIKTAGHTYTYFDETSIICATCLCLYDGVTPVIKSKEK